MQGYKLLFCLIALSVVHASSADEQMMDDTSAVAVASDLRRSSSVDTVVIEMGVQSAIQEDRISREPSSRRTIEPETSEAGIDNYYDRDAYITERVQRLILDEARYAVRARIYNAAGAGFMWLAGLSAGTTTVISILGGSEIVPPVAASVATGCLGAFSGVCMWASTQCKKSGDQYYQASTSIQIALGVPRQFISPKVDIRIDPFRQGPQASEPPRTHGAIHSSAARRTGS